MPPVDPAIAAAARALAAGHALAALKWVGVRKDATGVALRGVALAQLGDYPRARELLRRAGRAFGARAPRERARCQAAEAEVALAMREVGHSSSALDGLARTLTRLGDAGNARQVRLVAARWALLRGRLRDARRQLARVDLDEAAPPVRALHHLGRAEIAMRDVRARDAAEWLARAQEEATSSGVAPLVAEVQRAVSALEAPCARLLDDTGILGPLPQVRAGELDRSGHVGQAQTEVGSRDGGRWRTVSLSAVERALGANALLIDGIRRAARVPGRVVSLARRPVLFAILEALGDRWPADTSRAALLAAAFGARVPSESFRARLRVEVGRLRAALRGLAEVEATPAGFRLVPVRLRPLLVLAPPVRDAAAAIEVPLLALLQDGAAWSTAALARAVNVSQRTLQRTLRELRDRGAVRALGEGRARRWVAAPLTGFATTLLLPGALATR